MRSLTLCTVGSYPESASFQVVHIRLGGRRDFLKLTLYAIKRDHIKGFDYLSPQAFRDACAFFGIPLAMIDFDNARTARVWLKVKLHDAIGELFYTDGQTKQGDSASPIKYTLSMAMQTAWLLHILQAADLAVIKTVNGVKGLYHTVADQLSVKLLCVEAMDDSIFFATSWAALIRSVTLSEQFGKVYGILTAWDSTDKTVCFHLGQKPPPTEIATVKFTDAGGSHHVPIVEATTILRTPIDDVTQGPDVIRRVIDDLPFPAGSKLTLSLIHRAMWMLAVPKILPKLNLLPIMPDQAIMLDDLMTRKVAACLQVDTTKTPILSLPLSKHGFDLPSIYRLNAKAAVTIVLRSLNHHLPIIRTMAQITMANWSCQAHSCTDPFERTMEGSGRPAEKGPHVKGAKAIAEQNAAPATWRIAGEYLRIAKLSIIHTDQSSLLNNVSFMHVAQRIHGLKPMLPVAPIMDLVPEVNLFMPIRLLLPRLVQMTNTGTPDQALDARTLLHWWNTINPQDALTTYDPGLLLPVSMRRTLTAAIIRANARAAPRDITRRADTWATDGSHVDLKTASKAVSTTAAVVGRSTSTFAIKGLVTFSGHGELLGLIAALHVIKVDRPRGESNLLTDYMNGITAIERARAPEMKIAQWAYRPQSEMYTWLGMLIKGQRLNPTTVRHVKAHTDASDPDSLLNDAADAAAKRAHSSAAPSHATLPPPTGYMRAYVPYDHLRGYAPDAWQSTLDNRLADLQFQALPPAHQARLQFGRLGSNTVVRPYFYTRSPAKLVLKVQYLARAGHLESDYLLWKKGKRYSARCSLCTYIIGNHRHLYRECPDTQFHRDKAIKEAVKRFRPHRLRNLSGDRLNAELNRLRPAFEEYLYDLIHDDNRPEYWNGLTGSPPKPLEQDDAAQAHDCVIQLASHIYGRWLRGKTDGSERPQSTRTSLEDVGDGGGGYSNRADNTDIDNSDYNPSPSFGTPPTQSLRPAKQWVHYGGRRHSQLATVDNTPTQSQLTNRTGHRASQSSGAGPSRKRIRDGQGDDGHGDPSNKRGRSDVDEEQDQLVDLEQVGQRRRDITPESMDGGGDGGRTGKGKGKRARGKERAADQYGDGLEGTTKKRRTDADN